MRVIECGRLNALSALPLGPTSQQAFVSVMTAKNDARDLNDNAVRQAAGNGNIPDIRQCGLDVADSQRFIDRQEIIALLDLRGLDDLVGEIDGCCPDQWVLTLKKIGDAGKTIAATTASMMRS